MGAVGVGREIIEGLLTTTAPVFNIKHWRILERNPMGCYFTPQQRLVDFYLKDGTVIRSRSECVDGANESIIGVTDDGRRFAIPADSVNYVLEVLP